MNENKFRAWDKEDKRMITDTQDFIPLIVTNKGVFKLSPLHEENLYSILPIDRFELMQSTGLKDKNNNEIYDGDIIERGEKYPEIVTYKDGDWTLDYSYATGKEKGYNYCNLGFYVCERKSCKVIGNIYENKELLTEKQQKTLETSPIL